MHSAFFPISRYFSWLTLLIFRLLMWTESEAAAVEDVLFGGYIPPMLLSLLIYASMHPLSSGDPENVVLCHCGGFFCSSDRPWGERRLLMDHKEYPSSYILMLWGVTIQERDTGRDVRSNIWREFFFFISELLHPWFLFSPPLPNMVTPVDPHQR